MATITVKKDGSGDHTTIDAACGAAAQDDTIEIYNGTYEETDIDLSVHGVTIQPGSGQTVKVEGTGTSSAYGFVLYASGTTFNNLEFESYRRPIRSYTAHGYKYHMSGCFVHECGGVDEPTFLIKGATDHLTVVDSCRVFNDSGSAFTLMDDYVEFKNCLLVNADHTNYGSSVIIADDANGINTTASFCTVVGSVLGAALIHEIGKVTNCIVSGAFAAGTPGAEGYRGAGGIESEDHSYNIVSVDGKPFMDFDGDARAPGTGDVVIRDFRPYFTSTTTFPSHNSSTDDFTLVKGRTATSIGPPVAYYTMEDGSGTTLTDVSYAGNRRSGTLVNSPTWSTTSKMGTYSLLFNGSTQYATIDAVAQDIAGSDFSICFWMKSNETNGWFVSINTSSGGNRLLMGVASSGGYGGKLRLYDVSGYEPISQTDVHDNNWHHIIWTFDASEYLSSIYIDGVLEEMRILTGSPVIASNDLVSIGMEWDPDVFNPGEVLASDFWEGYIDDFAIFDALLEPEHVLQLYNNGDGMDARCGFGCDTEYINPAINGGVTISGLNTDLPGAPRPHTTGIIYTHKVMGIASGSLNRCMGVVNQATPDCGAYEYNTGQGEIKGVFGVEN